MREALVTHLESLHLLYESQHGFRRGRSCLSNLLTFLEKVTKAIDDGLSMDVVYLDLAKALKLTKHCTNRDVRLHFFSERVINNWNLLDQMVVDSDLSLIHI